LLLASERTRDCDYYSSPFLIDCRFHAHVLEKGNYKKKTLKYELGLYMSDCRAANLNQLEYVFFPDFPLFYHVDQ